MRILAFHPSAELYGSDRVFLEAVVALNGDRAVDLDVWTGSDGPLLSLMHRNAVYPTVRPVPRLVRSNGVIKSLLGQVRGLPAVRSLSKELSAYDRCYVSTVTSPLLLVAAKIAGVPVVLHLHEYPPGYIERRLIGMFSRKHSDSLVCVSRQAAVEFRGRFVRNPVSYDIVSSATGRREVQSFLDQGGRLRVLMMARWLPWKGHDVLFDALEILAREGDAGRITIAVAGDGVPGRDDYTRHIMDRIRGIQSLGVEVSITGFIDDASRLYRGADVLVAPSSQPEPYGLAVIEAQLSGCAVVATATGGHLETILDQCNGRLFTPGSAHDLASVLHSFVDDTNQVVELARSGQQWAHAQLRRTSFGPELVSAVTSDLTSGGHLCSG